MAWRYLADEEVIRGIFEDSNDEENDLAELLSSESESEPDEDDISPSTLDPDEGDDDKPGEYGSEEGDVNENFI